MLRFPQCQIVDIALYAAYTRAYNRCMESNVFELTDIELAGTSECVLAGGRDLFSRLPEAFAGVREIGVIGWGPQGRAQALNLRDSLQGTDLRVSVGLRAGSASFDKARQEGFSEAEGTL